MVCQTHCWRLKEGSLKRVVVMVVVEKKGLDL